MTLLRDYCRPVSLWTLSVCLVILCVVDTTKCNPVATPLKQYETCCDIQADCDGCTNLYKVNSITYCCPNCDGEVLVTGLICTCTISVDDPDFTPNCTVSNKIVGDYYFGLSSWYTSGGERVAALAAVVPMVGFMAVICGLFATGGLA